MNIRIINAPRPDVLRMLERHLSANGRERLKEAAQGAVALLQTNVADLFYFADLAEKASNVVAVEVFGTCPQHITTLALCGETSAVRAAVNAIENDDRRS
jgi:hypothetical protein